MGRILIRGGTVVDGTGSPARLADVLVEEGVIVEVGHPDAAGAEVVDATGLLVTPGWVDIHTHYDGQVFWDPLLTPSSWHGTTTAVTGSCGVGFAPVRRNGREGLIDLMMKIEDIPTETLRAGLPWGWETFAEYLEAVDRTPRAIDTGALVPHGAVRTYVMGERAERGVATSEEIATIAAIIGEAVAAGALGCSTNRSQKKGSVVPGSFAADEELLAIAQAVGAQGGLMQTAPAWERSDWTTEEHEIELLYRQSVAGGCTVTFSLVEEHTDPQQWRRIVARVESANASGAKLVPQVLGRPLNALFGLDARHLFERVPAYQELVAGASTLAERVARMREPMVRQRVISEAIDLLGKTPLFESLYPFGSPPDYEPDPSTSISAAAHRAGLSPVEVFYDKLTDNDGQGLYLYVAASYAGGNGDVLLEMFQHPETIWGIGDGGAHCLTLCDATTPTTVLTQWVRDRTRGPKLPLEAAVHQLSLLPARGFGLMDRGALLPGMRADINLIDFDALTIGDMEFLDDLPGGHRRVVQRPSGYVATYVAGEKILAAGVDTGARPGRTIRNRSMTTA